MSSILKALKKLEGANSASRGGASARLWSNVIPGQAVPRRTRSGWWISLGLMGLAALLGAALAGGWFWRPAATSATGDKAAAPNPKMRPAITGSLGDTTPRPPESVTPAKPPSPSRAGGFPNASVSTAEPAGRSQGTRPFRSAPAGSVGVSTGEVLPDVRPQPSATPAPSTEGREALPDNASGRAPPPRTSPLIDIPGLKLQAIAWSTNPTERIAVVNSSILREGDTVEGYRVVQINRDDVMLRSGGGEGRLLFGAK